MVAVLNCRKPNRVAVPSLKPAAIWVAGFICVPSMFDSWEVQVLFTT
jgi:hypothetical protein